MEYIESQSAKEQQKILKYIEVLRQNKGCLPQPYSKHIKNKIWEMRIDFSRRRHRIFYFILIGKTIILLNAFLKKTPKTPLPEIKKAENRYIDALNNKYLYE